MSKLAWSDATIIREKIFDDLVQWDGDSIGLPVFQGCQIRVFHRGDDLLTEGLLDVVAFIIQADLFSVGRLYLLCHVGKLIGWNV